MKKIAFVKQLTFFIALFCAVNYGFGQILTFEFDGILGGETTVNSNFNNANLTNSTISRGTGLVAVNSGSKFNGRGWELTTIPNAVTGNKYMQFTITPNAGFQFNITTIVFHFQRSNTGVNQLALRASNNGYTTNIDAIKPVALNNNITEIITFNVNLVNQVSAITFRIYGAGATNANNQGGFLSTPSLGNDIIVNGSVTATPPCPTTVTWDGATWSPSAPTLSTVAVINGNYNTSIGNIASCSLTVNAGFTLTVNNNTYVQVQNDVNNSGNIVVETRGAFVQVANTGTFNLLGAGTSSLNKTTALKNAWYYYTYWSSPVFGETINNAFPNTDVDRRFLFNAANYLDQHTVGTTNGIPDDIDDNGDDWALVSGTDIMAPGKGYAATSSPFGFYPSTDIANFIGRFNTGTISTGISYNSLNTLGSWNFIGNPYPSAIDFIAFHAANSSVVSGAAYFWSQSIPPNVANPGNQSSNFSKNDYATFTVGTGGAAGASGIIPTQFIPSAQGFFIAGIANGNVNFTNAMRKADVSSNNQFFKNTKSKDRTNNVADKLWVNLTSDNGVFNQILVGYVEGATNQNDGMSYDATRILTDDVTATLYSFIESEGTNKKYVIQGKDVNSINTDEIIAIGFNTTINEATLYKLSIAQLEGDFLTNNSIYLVDHLLNKTHDLKVCDYTFTSEVGEFNNRFSIAFTNKALAVDDAQLNTKAFKIVELQDDLVQFKTNSNLAIKTVNIYDLLGRELYTFKGENTSETYKLSNLKNSIFVAKVTLSDGTLVTKKAIKK